MFNKVPISHKEAMTLIRWGDWTCAGENTGEGYVYWNKKTGELLENPESDKPAYWKRDQTC